MRFGLCGLESERVLPRERNAREPFSFDSIIVLGPSTFSPGLNGRQKQASKQHFLHSGSDCQSQSAVQFKGVSNLGALDHSLTSIFRLLASGHGAPTSSQP